MKNEMKTFAFKVCLCDGHFCDGVISVKAETEDDAYDLAMDYVLQRLANALPELGIEVSLSLV